jgi:hypothetical protein
VGAYTSIIGIGSLLTCATVGFSLARHEVAITHLNR